MDRLCDKCKFFMTEDSGYSNYTVLETEIHCLKNNNSFFPTEESYTWLDHKKPIPDALKVAENCDYFKEGEV